MRKQRNTNRRSMFFITFVLILLLGIGFVQITNSYNLNKQYEEELASVNEEVEAAKRRNVELRLTIDRMGTKEYIEEMARFHFDMIYPDETKIEIVDGN